MTAKKGSKKSVVLTFDDGPGRVLPSLLDILSKEKVPAAFFWQSRLLFPQRPWKRVLDEGHQIGTHSTKHVNLSKLSFNEQYTDIAGSVEKLENITGKEIAYFRPPFGQYNNDTLAVAESLNLVPVMWRISSMDWELKNNPEQIIDNVIQHLEDGAIILLHELPQTLKALPNLIREIRARGYQFTSL
ncbi:polysaccharide deacetylase [Mesobacillus campisalis]|uniref:Polysaccharide deacetylase n=1 Tax=Mesobacillus campisalis TaxID=1408103 RepID=A0A0M2SVS1_9BACI|nr:polysaccharide deacetylase family protein [Mesobacillus campisalis]KKK38664.1 polysaccharide deacetylase [Mesobacillus campisalis]